VNKFCDVCGQANSNQLPFSTSHAIYSHPLELLYIDIWDFAYMVATSGARYCIAF